MPSSLIVGALVLAWLVVLVPMIARKRQVVTRTADSALEARVVQRKPIRRAEEKPMPVPEHVAPTDEDQCTAELPVAEPDLEDMDEVDPDQVDGAEPVEEYPVAGARADEHAQPVASDDHELDARVHDTEQPAEETTPAEDLAEDNVADEFDDEPSHDELAEDELTDEELADEELTDQDLSDDELDPGECDTDNPEPDDEDEPEYVTRPYRPGRGGYDPEAAELAAAAKYSLRRRIVLSLLIALGLSVVLGLAVSSMVYWATLALGLGLAGYLTYLRRQVRIEEDIRRRRAARRRLVEEPVAEPEPRVEAAEQEPAQERVLEPVRRHRPSVPTRPGAVVVDYDDEDPAFADLDDPDVLPYRRAAGY